MKQIVILIVLVFRFSVCFAQTKKIDSLRKTLPSLKDTARIERLIQIWVEFVGKDGNEPIKKEAIDSAIRYTDIVEQESRKINYMHGIAESYGMKGIIQNRYYGNF